MLIVSTGVTRAARVMQCVVRREEMSPANSGTNTNNGDGDGHSADVSAYPRHSPQIGRTPRNVAAAAPHRYRPGSRSANMSSRASNEVSQSRSRPLLGPG